jgi:hypothetical protein
MSWSHGGGKWLGLRGLVRASETKWKPWLTQREREREIERDGVGESELLDLCVRLRKGEGETAELLVYTSGNDDR